MVDVIVEGRRYIPLDGPIVLVDGVRYVPAPSSEWKAVNGELYVPEAPRPISEEVPIESDQPGRWHAALRDLETDYPTGAWGMSDQTARSQVGMSGGRDASKKIVEINLTRAVPPDYWSHIRQVASEFKIPAEVLCAIFCRESHHGFHLDMNGEGDRGNAFGVGQVDERHHEQRGRPDPYSLEHMRQCAEILVDNLEQVERKHPTWPDKYTLKGGVCAYNFGVKNVQTVEGMDRGTTGDDYGADTLARAWFYIELMPPY